MHHYVLSAIGRDRPGIVAAVTGAMLEHGVNVEDSQMTILRGHFAMTIVFGLAEDADLTAVERRLRAAGEQVGLEALLLERIDDLRDAGPDPSHMVTVYGADHPGIVHSVSSAAARHGYDITDLNTHLSVGGVGDEPLYVLMMELAVEPGHDEELKSAMEGVARAEGVEVSVSPLETDEL